MCPSVVTNSTFIDAGEAVKSAVIVVVGVALLGLAAVAAWRLRQPLKPSCWKFNRMIRAHFHARNRIIDQIIDSRALQTNQAITFTADSIEVFRFFHILKRRMFSHVESVKK